jgi:phosphatidate phosphatase APP1
MSSWLSSVARLAAAVEEGVDLALYGARDRLGGRLPPRVVAYRGYGTAERVSVIGRVVRDEPLPATAENATLWDNLLASYRRFETDEVPGALLRVRTAGGERTVSADEEGYFTCDLPPGDLDAAVGEWHSAQVELLAPREAGATAVAVAPVLVPVPTAAFGIISDIDDTVVRTDATQFLRMARTVFLGNARTRLPFPGVAAFYRALRAGTTGADGNPIFYVSSSPWNFYELLIELFEIQGVPLGPIMLRDWGVTPDELLPIGHGPHKLTAIRRILATYPALSFILVGDSGQEDPEIYASIIREFPQRILAAYIRSVTRDERRVAAVRALSDAMARDHAPLVLTDDTLAAARHAAASGWIPQSAIAAVQGEKRKDE